MTAGRIFVVAFLFVTAAVRAQDPKTIIQNYLDKVSNNDINNWKKITTIYIEKIGAYSQDNYTQSKPDFDIMRPDFSKEFLVMPDKHKIEIYSNEGDSIPSSKFYFLRDKTVIFIGNIPPMEKPGTDIDLYQQTPVMIHGLLQKAKSVVLLGMKEFKKESAVCYEIEVRTKDKTDRLYINKKTGLLDYWSSTVDGASSMKQFAGYRKFGDLMFPTKEVSSKNDIPFYWHQILKLELNLPINPKEFTYKLEPLR